MKPEQIEQISFMNWCQENLSDEFPDIHHFANERKCSVIEGRLLKRMGVKKGVPDIFVAICKNDKGGLWIELKSGKGKVTKEQASFIERKLNNGYEVAVCWTWQSAVSNLLTYLKYPLSMLKSE